MMALRTKVLKYLEKKPTDFITLSEDLDVYGDAIASELNNLLKAGYITKKNGILYLTNRGREYLKVEES